MAVILAFGSAAVLALGIVLQRVVMDAPEAKEASAGLLFRLIQHPVWLDGIAAYRIAFGMRVDPRRDGGDRRRRRADRRRAGPGGGAAAAFLGTASGLLFGLVSALTKCAVEVLQDDGVGMLANWHLYVLIVVGFAGMTITELSLGTRDPAVGGRHQCSPGSPRSH